MQLKILAEHLLCHYITNACESKYCSLELWVSILMEKKLILLLSSGSVVDFVSSSFEADFCSLKNALSCFERAKIFEQSATKDYCPRRSEVA